MRLVDQVEEAFPGVLSRADIQVFFGGLAIEHMGGPRVPFRYGRKDFTEAEALATGMRALAGLNQVSRPPRPRSAEL